MKRTTQNEPEPKNREAATPAKRTAAASDANEQTHTQLENAREEGRTTASPRPGNKRANSTTWAANGAGQPTNDRRATRVDMANLNAKRQTENPPAISFLRSVSRVAMGSGVSPDINCEATIFATCEALDTRSHPKAAGVALRQ